MEQLPAKNWLPVFELSRRTGMSEQEILAKLAILGIQGEERFALNDWVGLHFPPDAEGRLKKEEVVVPSANGMLTVNELSRTSGRSRKETQRRLEDFGFEGEYRRDRLWRIQLHYESEVLVCLRLVTVIDNAQRLTQRTRWVRSHLVRLNLNPVVKGKVSDRDYYDPKVVVMLRKATRYPAASRGMRTVKQLMLERRIGRKRILDAFAALRIKGQMRLAANGSLRIHYMAKDIELLLLYLQLE